MTAGRPSPLGRGVRRAFIIGLATFRTPSPSPAIAHPDNHPTSLRPLERRDLARTFLTIHSTLPTTHASSARQVYAGRSGLTERVRGAGTQRAPSASSRPPSRRWSGQAPGWRRTRAKTNAEPSAPRPPPAAFLHPPSRRESPRRAIASDSAPRYRAVPARADARVPWAGSGLRRRAGRPTLRGTTRAARDRPVTRNSRRRKP